MVGEDTFESRFPEEFLGVLLTLGREFGFDPLASVELEDYFSNLLANFTGKVEHFDDWLRPQLAESFRYVTCPPSWVQGGNWQVYQGRPMLFVGQVSSTKTPNRLLPERYCQRGVLAAPLRGRLRRRAHLPLAFPTQTTPRQ